MGDDKHVELELLSQDGSIDGATEGCEVRDGIDGLCVVGCVVALLTVGLKVDG